MLDRLYGQEQQSKDPGAEVHRFYQGFSQAILALLSFIEERFSKYFDKGEKVPDVYLALVRQEVRQKLAALSKILQSKAADELIAGQLFQKLGAFVAPPKAMTLAYREIMFYKELVKELEDLTHWEKGSGMYSGLQQLLIYLNFNDKEFINEMVNRMVAELQGMEDLNEKIDRLLLYSKAINQLQLKPDSGLNARHPSVKNQLGSWFAEELSYLERKLAGFQTVTAAAPPDPKDIKNKILCHLPVDQLGIFFRASADLKLISAGSQKALFEQIAPWLATPHRGSLSPDSMRSKSYSPEKRDLEAVKDILMQLFRQIGKY